MADELERLLGLPLDEFTAARTEAVKRLRKEGQADEAADLQAVKKPTAPVWALNQAARREPGDVRALVRAAERLRQDPAGADADFRSYLGDVVREAERALAETDHKVSQETTRRITTTARAAAASVPDELIRGVLREELEPSGFEAMAGLAPPPKPPGAKKAASKKDDAAAKRKRVEEARGALADAQAEARRLGQEADAAERDAAKARAAADEGEEAVRRAAERPDAARGAQGPPHPASAARRRWRPWSRGSCRSPRRSTRSRTTSVVSSRGSRWSSSSSQASGAATAASGSGRTEYAATTC